MGCLVEEQTTDMRGEPRNVVCMAIEMDTLYTRPDYPMNRSGKAQSNRCRPPCQIQRVNAGSGFQMPVSFRVFGHASLSECACIPHRHPQWRGQLHVDANISEVIKNTAKICAFRCDLLRIDDCRSPGRRTSRRWGTGIGTRSPNNGSSHFEPCRSSLVGVCAG